MIKMDNIKISSPDSEYIITSGLPGFITKYPGNFYNLRLFYDGDVVYNLQFDDYMMLCSWLINNYETIEAIGIGSYLSRCFGWRKQWAVSMNFKEEEK